MICVAMVLTVCRAQQIFILVRVMCDVMRVAAPANATFVSAMMVGPGRSCRLNM
jgi:hypothetical protein